jgi:hypothetical protein
MEVWTLVVVYGPCRQPTRNEFVNWLYNLNIGDEELWLLIGDFNFYRSSENRNRPGGISIIASSLIISSVTWASLNCP